MSKIHLLFAALLLTAGQSSAKPKKARNTVETTDGGYAYSFKDDPLSGLTNGLGSGLIKVMPRGMRRTLIRPRVSFVPEMLKSVENI